MNPRSETAAAHMPILVNAFKRRRRVSIATSMQRTDSPTGKKTTSRADRREGERSADYWSASEACQRKEHLVRFAEARRERPRRRFRDDDPAGCPLQVFRINDLEMVDQIFASWNRVADWLSRIQVLRIGWRALLATKHIQEGRQLLREVLAGPLSGSHLKAERIASRVGHSRKVAGWSNAGLTTGLVAVRGTESIAARGGQQAVMVAAFLGTREALSRARGRC